MITHVHTTLSTVTDEATVEPIHQSLAAKSLLPEEHLMALGYVTAQLLVFSQQEHGVEIILRVGIIGLLALSLYLTFFEFF